MTATWFEHDGLGLKVPSATELLWHGVAHGVHQGAAGFRLRFLLDAAAVWCQWACGRLGPDRRAASGKQAAHQSATTPQSAARSPRTSVSRGREEIAR